MVVGHHTNDYPYSSYLMNLTNLSSDQKKTLGSSILWNPKPTSEDDRLKFFNLDNVTFTGICQPKHPMFTQQLNLMPFVKVSLTFNRVVNPDFYFRWDPTGKPKGSYRLKILSAVLFVRKVTVQDQYNQAVEKYLEAGNFVHMRMTEPRMTTRTYAGFGTQIIEDNLLQGVLPKHITMGFVDNTAYTGATTLNPFAFQHFKKLKEVALYVNGAPFPYLPIDVDFDSKNTAHAYFLLHAFGAHQTPDPPMILKDEFDEGHTTLFAFNMAPDQRDGEDTRMSTGQPANVRAVFQFSSSDLTKSITLLIRYEVDTEVLINRNRQVLYHTQ